MHLASGSHLDDRGAGYPIRRAALPRAARILAPIAVAGIALVASGCSGDDAGAKPAAKPPDAAGRLQLTCRAPSGAEAGNPADIVAVLVDDRGKPVAGEAIQWSLSSVPGTLTDANDRPLERSETDASGQAMARFWIAFDVGFSGEVVVAAEAAGAAKPLRCEARFPAFSGSLPRPPGR